MFLCFSLLPLETAVIAKEKKDSGFLYPYFINGKHGFINKKGKVVVTPRYDDILEFVEGVVGVRRQNWGWGFINAQGKNVVDLRYSDLHSFSEGLAAVEQKKLWGFVNQSNQRVIELQFDRVEDFHDGVAAVSLKGKWGFIDDKGKWLIEPSFDAIHEETGQSLFRDDKAWVRVENKWGLIDPQGKWLIKPSFEGRPSFFSEGLAAVQVKESGPRGYIDESGKIVIKPAFEVAGNFHEGLASVEGKEGSALYIAYIDKKGKEAFRFKNAWGGRDFKDGLAAVEFEAGFKFVNRKGKVVIAPKKRMTKEYDIKGPLRQIELNNDKCGLIDTKGNFVIPADYRTITPMENGLYQCKQVIPGKTHNTYHHYDNTGKLIMTFICHKMGPFKNGLAPVFKENKIGYINKRGKYIWSMVSKD